MQRGNKRNISVVILVAVMALAMHPQAVAEKLFDLQGLIDKAAEKDGTVRLEKGRYVIGSVDLKSGVTLHLEEGAMLLGSTNPFDYKGFVAKESGADLTADKCSKPLFALISAHDASNVAITGRGTIDGRGLELALAIDSLHHTGVIRDPNYNTRRMRPANRPKLLDFENVKHLTIENVNLRSSASWGLSLKNCSDVTVRGIDFVNRAYWNNDGIDISDCKNVLVEKCHINSADDGIVLKSFDANGCNDGIEIRDCDIESSASAFKIGTESFGGFRNVTVKNLRIKDTFRSAVAIETVDGAFLENVSVDSVTATNTGNAFFIRLGHRRGEKPGSLRNVTISNLRCEIPFGRPDEDYDLRGPDINVIHNPFPASITGIPGHKAENIMLRNIDVSYPGRGTKGMGYIGAYRYKDVPENIDSYPEFHMFGELPAWALYMRHVDGVTFDNVKFTKRADDYRRAIVAVDDVSNVTGMDKIRTGTEN